MNVQEVNFDGLIGPTHHYGGYAYGNLASMLHKKQISYPKKAAREGLNKMKLLADYGIPQAVLPPPLRPSFATLRALGFTGSDTYIFEYTTQFFPTLFYKLCSASSMWAANSATVSPSTDTHDGKFHLTIANLNSQFHRSIEAQENYRLFRWIFPNKDLFKIHPPLPQGGEFGDEGAANHTRLCKEYGSKGLHLFMYGKSAFESDRHHFPFRQAKEASEAVARLHGLDQKRTFFIRQNPRIIEEGVFHNDVISVGNQNIFLYHEKAFIDTAEIIKKIQDIFPVNTICVTEEMLSIKAAVKTYFFNGQLVTLPDQNSLLLLPKECLQLNLDWLPINSAFIDVTESMLNGGGPACLRLRCVLNEQERAQIHPYVFLNQNLYTNLSEWIEKYYRDRLTLTDLSDPSLLLETKEALDRLTQILHLGSFYEFQREVSFNPNI